MAVEWDAMIESGRIVAPQDDDDVLVDEPVEYGIDATTELLALRGHEMAEPN